jgi:hypothetical protein
MVSVGGAPFLSVTGYARLLGWLAEQRLEAPALVDLLVEDHGRIAAIRGELRRLRRQGAPEAIRHLLDEGMAGLRPVEGLRAAAHDRRRAVPVRRLRVRAGADPLRGRDGRAAPRRARPGRAA